MILIEKINQRKKLLGYNIEGILVARECTKCGEFKSICEYSKHARASLGYNTSCKDCGKSKEIRAEVNKKRRAWRKENRDEYLKQRREYRSSNKEKVNARERALWEKHKDKYKAKCVKWKKENAHVCIEYVRIREFKKKRSLNTLSPEQRKEVAAIYKESRKQNDASEDGTIYCVDHIIPLTHPDVCGLHAPQNLTILNKSENSKKQNQFDGTNENTLWRTRRVKAY